jgi:hypothetical protein
MRRMNGINAKGRTNTGIGILLALLGFTAITGIFGQGQDSSLPGNVGLSGALPDPNDSFICTKIKTFVDGVEYDQTMKCETRDAICYVMEGFAMSCVPKIPPDSVQK